MKIRVDPDLLEVWRAAASTDRVTLSQFIRDSVEVRLRSMAIVHDALVSAEIDRRLERPAAPYGHPEPVVYGTRSSSCRNRQRHTKGVRCGYCGTTP